MFAAVVALNSAMAQNKSNIVIFSEDGEPFFAFVNGVKQNDNAQTNVKVADLTAESFSFRIVFANSGNEPITKQQYLPFGSEYTFRIKRDKKGNLVMRGFGEVPLAQASTGVPTVIYHATENPAPATDVSTTTTTTTTTTTNTVPVVNEPAVLNTTGENVNMNMNTGVSTNAGGENVNMNVSTGVNGGTVNGSENVNMSVTVGTNGMSMNVNVNGTGEAIQTDQHVYGTTTTEYTTTTTTTSTSTGNVNTQPATVVTTGCAFPVDEVAFGQMKSSIESKNFSDTKLSTAQQAVKSNCVSTAQVKELMKLFNGDEDKLAFAKYAYDYTTDRQNFYQVGEAFTFDMTTDELNTFLNSKQ